MEVGNFPPGLPIFVRLSHNKVPIEDTEEIATDERFDGCVWFEFSPTKYSGGFTPGEYEAIIFINGNLVDTVAFEVR